MTRCRSSPECAQPRRRGAHHRGVERSA